MKLYVTSTSGNAWKVRLLLSMLKLPFETVLLDPDKKEHKTPEFLKLNPRGQVPVLVDGDHVFWDSTACLVYLARKHGGEQWLPTDAAGMAGVQQWLALSNNELHYGLQWGRGKKIGIRAIGDYEEYAMYGRSGLAVLEGRLKNNEWLMGGKQPTIADLACYCYTSVSPEGGFDLAAHPGVAAWVKRVEALPGWIKRV